MSQSVLLALQPLPGVQSCMDEQQQCSPALVVPQSQQWLAPHLFDFDQVESDYVITS